MGAERKGCGGPHEEEARGRDLPQSCRGPHAAPFLWTVAARACGGQSQVPAHGGPAPRGPPGGAVCSAQAHATAVAPRPGQAAAPAPPTLHAAGTQTTRAHRARPRPRDRMHLPAVMTTAGQRPPEQAAAGLWPSVCGGHAQGLGPAGQGRPLGVLSVHAGGHTRAQCRAQRAPGAGGGAERPSLEKPGCAWRQPAEAPQRARPSSVSADPCFYRLAANFK